MTTPEALAYIIADQSRIADLPPRDVPELLGELGAVQARLLLRLQTASAAPSPAATKEQDRLLTIQEAADRLGVTVRWLYANARDLPFSRKLGARTLRFSEQGIARHLAKGRP